MYTIANISLGTLVSTDILTRTEAVKRLANLRAANKTMVFKIFYLMVDGE